MPSGHDYGIAVWARPLDKNLEIEKHNKKTSFLNNHMGRESLEIYNSIVNFMLEKSTSLIDEKSWYLSIIGILPEFQGQGFGTTLVNNILDRTDSLGVPTYLETFTPRNVPFYTSIGYQCVECFYEPTIKEKYWIMSRGF